MSHLVRPNPWAARRRLVMPALLLATVGVVVWWSAAREARRMEDVGQAVRAMCAEITQGKDMAGRLNPWSTAAERQIIHAVQQALPSPDLVDAIEIAVAPGDVSQGNTLGSQASHTVMLRLDGVDLLTLRVQHRDDHRKVVVLGYALPADR